MRPPTVGSLRSNDRREKNGVPALMLDSRARCRVYVCFGSWRRLDTQFVFVWHPILVIVVRVGHQCLLALRVDLTFFMQEEPVLETALSAAGVCVFSNTATTSSTIPAQECLKCYPPTEAPSS
ncbi:hypothetical protein NEOLEDRAFT_390414 [Neolentinus lepideus HHB14362 ss-1]|uniref:Uncharacterized protein n=1 Tax=Neolentinus lepideus HHB14362 ss-1 TaxID=1314782 RepID=A0A165SFZ7_9AGAM|nr:hypothetical protein NEOLEDRAFT_390414 [Neolentinus lepideus HHB14362 ss-1]